MAIHRLSPTSESLHGYFSRDREPVLEIDPGDTVVFDTLDASWGINGADPFAPRVTVDRPTANDVGHALVGPVFIRSARPGMTLEIQIQEIVPGNRGETGSGGWSNWTNERLGLVDANFEVFRFALNAEQGLARTEDGRTFPIRPFMGIYGMPTDEPGILPTRPPRRTGGNIDCRLLTAESVLWLPIEVDGGLFSTGDGHAIQGDGEIAGPALECPMAKVALTFNIHDFDIPLPRARVDSAMIGMGFGVQLDDACAAAIDNITNWMCQKFNISRQEAVAMFSLVGNLHVSQVVNETKGVHAIFDPAKLGNYFP